MSVNAMSTVSIDPSSTEAGELLEREHPRRDGISAPSRCSMSVSSSSEPASRTGPVNHLRAESRYQPPNRITAPPTVSGA